MIEIIKDKIQRNASIYADAIEKGKIMGIGYTLLLWKNHTKFLFRLRNPKDKFEEVDRVVKFVEKHFGTFADRYCALPVYNYDLTNDDSWKQNKIWIYWNNPDSMPLMVKACVERIMQMSNGHEVVILTDKNLRDYIELEPVVWKKYDKGLITKTHISDFIRVAVLYKYGGLYLDSTVYPTRPLDDKFFKSPLFTNHTKWDGTDAQIAHKRWSSFMCGCRKENLLMRAALDVLTEYWRCYDKLMDYVLIDYTYNLLYEHVPSIKKMIDSVPINNINIWGQQHNLPKVYSKEQFEKLLTDKSMDLYKFSYKNSIGIPMQDERGDLTLMGRICMSSKN